MKMKNYSAKCLCLTLLSGSIFASREVKADTNPVAFGHTYIGTIQNPGTLATERYLENSTGGSSTRANQKDGSAGAGQEKHFYGTARASLTNNSTVNEVTTEIAPYLWLQVDGTTIASLATSDAAISLGNPGGVNSVGACSGNFGSYGLAPESNKTYSFGNVTIQPGASVSAEGFWQINVKGGSGGIE